MSEIAQDLETARRRLLWRAMHRGIKEMDIIVGGFAAARLPAMTVAEISKFETLLELPDQDLLAWLTGQAEIPADVQSPLLAELLAFRPVLR